MPMNDNAIRRVIEATAANLQTQQGAPHPDNNDVGQQAIVRIQSALHSIPGADSALQALAQFQRDPSATLSQRELAAELTQLAERHPTLLATLEPLASDVRQAEPPTTRGYVPDAPSVAEADVFPSESTRGTYRSMYSDNDTDQDDSRW